MTAFDPDKITFFGKTDARGQGVTFGIKAKDRQRHMYVIGKTGMGKSTLLENMAAQDIMNGEGVAFIDPHGSTAETLLEYVPEHRVKDVVYFAPFDMDNPVSFNVMEDVGVDKRHLVVSGLMSTFKKIWVDAWSARMEYILTNALLVLIEYPDTTLLSVNRLFSDKAYRKKVVEYCQDPAVKSFWVDEYAGYTERFTAEALPAIQNKIGQFTGNPLIRNIIGQPHSSFDIRKMMDEKKILIMNLSKGLIGDTNANLLGSMLTTRIYLAAMSRANLPVAEMKKMPNFYFYVDEFQSFANATFADILSEARKYHLNLIIAHQYIQQMEEEVRDAVFGNVGTTITFRVGPFDAEVLETVFAPKFEATDLVNLGEHQIYLTLMIDGIGSQPFSALTLPPVQKPDVSCSQLVVETSRKQYTNKREGVEKLVAELHTPVTPEKPNKQLDKKPYTGQNGQGGQRKQFDKKPNQNYKKEEPSQTRNNSNNEEYKKPAQSDKTPNDLRNILSKIAGSEKQNVPEIPVKEIPKEVVKSVEEKTKLNEKQNETKDREPHQFQDRKNNHQNRKPREENRNTKFPEKKNFESVKPKNDLKQALADILKQAKEAEGQTSKVETKQEPKVESHSQGGIHPRRQTPSPNFIQPTSNQNSQVRKVVVENKKMYQEETHQTESSSKEQQVHQSPSSLNASEIKKMLKQSDNERSPFN
jgi:hypothetical protein